MTTAFRRRTLRAVPNPTYHMRDMANRPQLIFEPAELRERDRVNRWIGAIIGATITIATIALLHVGI
jgi:hypothetical protein